MLFVVRRACVVLVVIGLSSSAAAEEAGEDRWKWTLPDASYLWDGGAIPLLYLPIAGYLLLKTQVEPRDQPLMFDAKEGGRMYRGGQYPTPMLYVDAALAAGIIVAGGDDSRWFHLKGFAQGIATTQFLTQLAKVSFGRHRPSYNHTDPTANTADARKSFWSGHSSSTLATATYLALYARTHLFDRFRPKGALPWWEAATYLVLAGAAAAVPYSQYHLGRHHASDVIVGSAVGMATAATMFYFQERRYKASKNRKSFLDRHRITATPNPAIGGFGISGTW